jgi:hypothetical protein
MRSTTRIFLALAMTLASCQPPRTGVSIPNEGPRLVILSAPPGAVLFLDSKAVGEAHRFDGKPEVLQVEVGTHLVEIRLNGTVIWSQKVFLGSSELRTIQL